MQRPLIGLSQLGILGHLHLHYKMTSQIGQQYIVHPTSDIALEFWWARRSARRGRRSRDPRKSERRRGGAAASGSWTDVALRTERSVSDHVEAGGVVLVDAHISRRSLWTGR